MEPSTKVAKNFAGKVSLYRVLDKRSPRTFLRRNIRDALDSHDHDLAREKSNATGIQDKGEQLLRTEWEPPSDRTMGELAQTSMPELRISSLHMRASNSALRRPRNSEEPSWLPKAGQSVRACQVRVLMRDIRNGTPSGNILYSELRQGRIIGHDNSNKRATFEIQLETPFDINIQQLQQPTPSFTGPGPWGRAIENDCVLEFDIQFQESESAAEFLSTIEDRPLSDYHDTAASEGIVKARWSKLPHLPQGGELLQLKRSKGHKSIELRYGLEVVMAWSPRPASALTRHSRAVRRRREQLRQLPTPVSDDLDAGRNSHDTCIIKYIFNPGTFEMRSVVFRNLKCLFCRSSYEQSSFERLQLHYLTHHDHLNYHTEELGDDLKVVRITNKDDEDVQEGHEFAWEAPQRPFNTRAYLGDDQSWVEPPEYDKPGPAGPYGNRRAKKKAKTASGKASAVPQAPKAKLQPLKLTPKKKFTEPEKVEDYVPHGRRKHMVPYVPGVEFYRTTSKQPLIPGSYCSDSDEEVDDTWMKQRQRNDYKRLGEDGISLDFNELFNRQLDEEQPMSDVFGNDAVVRFTRKYVDLLKDPKWKEKLEAKLNQLESKRILRKETVKYCLHYVETAQKKDSEAGGTPQTAADAQKGASSSGVASGPQQNTTYSGKVRMRWFDGAMRLTDEQGAPLAAAGANASTTTKNEKSPGAPQKPRHPNSGPCICGVKVQGFRGTIACANVKCLTYGFHRACLKLDHWPTGWKCDECKASSG